MEGKILKTGLELFNQLHHIKQTLRSFQTKTLN